MSTPVQTPSRAHPQPQARPAPETTPAPNATRPALGGLRRGETDRLRAAWSQPTQPETTSADGLFFSQLLIPTVSEAPDHSRFSGSGLSLLPPADGVPTQLMDELAQRLPSQPDGPFNVTLLMPYLGKVQVNASKRENHWSIELAFAKRGVLKRLQPHQRACESALAEALGQDVDVSLHEELPA